MVAYPEVVPMSVPLPVSFAYPSGEDPIDGDILIDIAEEDDATKWSPWTVTDLSSADWAMSKVAEAEEELARVGEYAEAQIARIKAWQASASAPYERTRAFFTDRLLAYAHQVRTDRAKTLSLPSGKVTSRRVAARPVVADEEALVEWLMAEGHGTLIRTKRSVVAAALTAETEVRGETVVIVATGETIPAELVEVAPERIDFHVVPDHG
jgi:phage host-nuclease inhibitor protein Gam